MNQQIIIAGAIGAVGLMVRHSGVSVGQNGSGRDSVQSLVGTVLCVGAVVYVCSAIWSHMHRNSSVGVVCDCEVDVNEISTNESDIDEEQCNMYINEHRHSNSDDSGSGNHDMLLNESDSELGEEWDCLSDFSRVNSNILPDESDSELGEEWDCLNDVDIVLPRRNSGIDH